MKNIHQTLFVLDVVICVALFAISIYMLLHSDILQGSMYMAFAVINLIAMKLQISQKMIKAFKRKIIK